VTRLRARAAVLLLAALAGCSAIKLTYNRLDWIAAWQLGHFVDLDAPQKLLFDERFDKFWAWHRGTQLPLYVADLRELAGTVAKPLPRAEVEKYLDRSREHLARSLQEIVPDTAKVLRTFDDGQVAELLENMARRRRDKAEESADMSLEELQEAAQEQMIRNLKRWTGPLNREQKARIGEWSRQRQYAGTVWHQYQEAWAGAFTEVLRHRQDADFETRLSTMFDNAQLPYGDEMEKVQAHNRDEWVKVMADLSALLTPDQRAHMQLKLRELADQLTELSSQPPQAALPVIIG
jgi:hypothetical protein